MQTIYWRNRRGRGREDLRRLDFSTRSWIGRVCGAQDSIKEGGVGFSDLLAHTLRYYNISQAF
jgi:hypothetical protein